MEGPIYTKFYIECEKDGIPVRFPTDDGYGTSFLRTADLDDLVNYKHDHGEYPAIYVQVEHKLEYPYAKWDFEGTDTGDLLSQFLPDQPYTPPLFCRAAIVATPSMALV